VHVGCMIDWGSNLGVREVAQCDRVGYLYPVAESGFGFTRLSFADRWQKRKSSLTFDLKILQP
jgi:hypothetical protein